MPRSSDGPQALLSLVPDESDPAIGALHDDALTELRRLGHLRRASISSADSGESTSTSGAPVSGPWSSRTRGVIEEVVGERAPVTRMVLSS